MFDQSFSLVELKQHLGEQRTQMLSPILHPTCSATEARSRLLSYTSLIDELINVIWQRCLVPEKIAALAVGGYGRRDLFPYSDIDILLLRSANFSDADKAAVEAFVQTCWDVGLEIGVSLRSLQECQEDVKQDITTATALLEARALAGSRASSDTLLTTYASSLDVDEFFVAKQLELQQRHNKFENTPYALEPNCKESPGGWRDLHVIGWIGKSLQLNDWAALRLAQFATDLECQELENCSDFLTLVRARLHLLAGRREDRLLFDLQMQLAHCFDPQLTSDVFMQQYYQMAKTITQIQQILLLSFQDSRQPFPYETSPINERFSEVGGRLDIVRETLYQEDSHAILDTFVQYARNPLTQSLSTRTLRSLYHARNKMDESFRTSSVNKKQFLDVLKSPQGVTHAMRLMNQTSVLGAYLPAFQAIVGKMQHDLFHVYTVDQHTLMVLRNLRRFFIAEHAHEFPLCSGLAVKWDKPWLLYLAALFHDIAKGRGGDHSELGVADALAFCMDHGLADDETDLVAFLVRHHLTMNRVAQRQDIYSTETIHQFAKTVGTEKKLTALYLLTVADIRGTSPKVWNTWKGKLLEDLYHATRKALGGEILSAQSEVELRKHQALTLLALQAQPFEVQKRLWSLLDVSYFMRQTASDIAWHTKHISRHIDTRTPVVRCRLCNDDNSLEVMVYLPNQANLFARICRYLDKHNISVIEAKIHTTTHHYVLDGFRVVLPSWVEHYREHASLLEHDLAVFLSSKDFELLAPMSGRISRRVKHFPIAARVEMHPDESAKKWLLDISSSDKVGLLYSIALVFAQFEITVDLAKINTLGERVEDTFLIEGACLSQERNRLTFEKMIMDVIDSSKS